MKKVITCTQVAFCTAGVAQLITNILNIHHESGISEAQLFMHLLPASFFLAAIAIGLMQKSLLEVIEIR